MTAPEPSAPAATTPARRRRAIVLSSPVARIVLALAALAARGDLGDTAQVPARAVPRWFD